MAAIVSVKNLSFSYESTTKKKAVSVENNQIKNIAEPTDNNDAVTKDYLLDMIASLQEQIDFLKQRFRTNIYGFKHTCK